jgi:hypothetical protein
MLADDVEEIINLLRNLTARGRRTEQRACEQSGSRNAQGTPASDVRPIKIHNEMGAWANVDSLPDWPLGVTKLQFFALEGDWPSFLQILVLMVRIAQAVLRSPNGARAYLADAHCTLTPPSGRTCRRVVGPVSRPETLCSPRSASHT